MTAQTDYELTNEDSSVQIRWEVAAPRDWWKQPSGQQNPIIAQQQMQAPQSQAMRPQGQQAVSQMAQVQQAQQMHMHQSAPAQVQGGGSMPMAITCPQDAPPGTRLQFNTPQGKPMQVLVPPGVMPGQTFSVSVPTAPVQAYIVTATAQPDQQSQPQFQQPPPPPPPQQQQQQQQQQAQMRMERVLV